VAGSEVKIRAVEISKERLKGPEGSETRLGDEDYRSRSVGRHRRGWATEAVGSGWPLSMKWPSPTSSSPPVRDRTFSPTCGRRNRRYLPRGHQGEHLGPRVESILGGLSMHV